MRMWNVEPGQLCRKHLLGEHAEMHMFIGAILKNKNLDGFINNGLVELHNIIKRHDVLAQEIQNRGYKHKSPLTCHELVNRGKVDINKSIKDLKIRCKECFKK